MGRKCKDQTGNVYGKWTVLRKAEEKNSYGDVCWICRCECGNEKAVSGKILRKGKSKSCGQCTRHIIKPGERFGKLITIEETGKTDTSRHKFWRCKCDCGNETIVPSRSLTTGNTTSCGCRTTSKGEEKIQNLLDSHNIKYKKEYTIREIGNKRFDFAILNDKEEVIKLIEYDGEQHFQEWTLSTKTTLAERQESDRIKNEWAAAHSIPLLRIPYWDYNKIDFDMLQL